MLSTPAMKVVATAPRPGVRTPSLPVAGEGCFGVLSADANVYFSVRIELGANRIARGAVWS